MKTIIKVIFLFLILKNNSCLHFDLNSESKRCYIEELFTGSVAVIKYKMWSTPDNLEKSKIKNINYKI